MDKRILYGLIAIIAILSFYVITSIDKTPDITNETKSINDVKPVSKTAEYIGSQSCNQCHQSQYQAWKGSHHDLAMQHANKQSILADFNNTSFKYYDITSRFFIKDKKYYVTTDGPDGELTDFEIKYTFGVEPLQQYLIELPGGHLQALGIAWDNRAKEQGGQRWYHLYPDEKITHTDRLHWTKADQNWNYMCADCHSTNLKKNYNIDNNTYKTSWSEINVACEACHGPASNHVDWVNTKPARQNEQLNKGLVVNLDERAGVNWQIDPTTGNAKRSKNRTTDKEIEICARCHSRRSQLGNNHEPGKMFMDNYQPALLTDFLYHPDGQIKDEVYVYGSFIQSKMYHKGVTCSDCHEPHSLKLRAEGNGVCLQCHSADKFNKPSHHFHKNDNKGASCAECHMPQTIYMGVDGRHDHSIRIPRPDLSITLSTPNACTQCHQDKTAKWANQQMQNWYGKDWSPGWHFGETLHDARTGKGTVGQDLMAVAASPKLPAIARASATDLLQNYPSPTTFVIIKKLLQDKDAMIRLAALRNLDNIDAQYRLKLGFGLLNDPVRIVRIEAARIMSVIPTQMMTVQQQAILDKAVNEYRAAQQVNADRPESHLNLGLLAIRLQQFDQAERAYRQALKLDSGFVNAYVNLADLYRMQQRTSEAEQVLQQGLKIEDDNADLHHALGLLYVRQQQMDKAIHELKTAWQLQKDNVRFGYVYAVALQGNDQTKQAIKILTQLHQIQANNQDVLIALISYLQNLGDKKTAREYAEKLLIINPQLGSADELLKRLASP